MTTPAPTDLLTPAEVADQLGTTADAITKRLGRNTLPGTKVRGRWYVKASDLAAHLAAERPIVNTPPPMRLPIYGGRPGDGFRARAAALEAEARDLRAMADVIERDGGRWSVAS